MNIANLKRLARQCILNSLQGAVWESLAAVLFIAWLLLKSGKPLTSPLISYLIAGFAVLLICAILEGFVFAAQIFSNATRGKPLTSRNVAIIAGSTSVSVLVFNVAFAIPLSDLNFMNDQLGWDIVNGFSIAVGLLLLNKIWTAYRLNTRLLRKEPSLAQALQAASTGFDKKLSKRLDEIGKTAGTAGAMLGSLVFSLAQTVLVGWSAAQSTSPGPPGFRSSILLVCLFAGIAGMGIVLAVVPGQLGGVLLARLFDVEIREGFLTKRDAVLQGLTLGGMAGLAIFIFGSGLFLGFTPHFSPSAAYDYSGQPPAYLAEGALMISNAALCGAWIASRVAASLTPAWPKANSQKLTANR